MPSEFLNRRSFLAAGAAAVGSAIGLDARAQTQNAVRLIYPFAAGSGGDTMARIVAEKLNAGLSVPVIVENRTGAAGRIGVKAVVTAEPDGTTLLFVPNPPVAIYPHSYPTLEYDPVRDLTPVSLDRHLRRRARGFVEERHQDRQGTDRLGEGQSLAGQLRFARRRRPRSFLRGHGRNRHRAGPQACQLSRIRSGHDRPARRTDSDRRGSARRCAGTASRRQGAGARDIGQCAFAAPA